MTTPKERDAEQLRLNQEYLRKPACPRCGSRLATTTGLDRLLELIKEDQELHDAVISLIEARRDAEKARQRWYETRTKQTGVEKK